MDLVLYLLPTILTPFAMQKEISGSLSVEDHKTPTTDSDNNTDDDCLLTVDRRPAAEQALVRKLDTRLLPTIVAIYIMNYIDVSSLYLIIQEACLSGSSELL